MGESVDAGETAKNTVQQAQGFLYDQVDRQAEALGARLSDTADDLRTISGDLRERNRSLAAGLTSTAADQVDRFASYIRDLDGARLVRDVKQVAREQAWLIAGAALIVGLAASRLLKSSADNGRDSYEYDNEDAVQSLQ